MTFPLETTTAILQGLVTAQMAISPDEMLRRMRREQAIQTREQQNNNAQMQYDFQKQIRQQPKHIHRAEQLPHFHSRRHR